VDRPDNNNGKTKVIDVSNSRTWWLLTTAVAVALIAGLGALNLIRLLALPLAILILGLTISASLEPVVAWLENRMPRTLAAVVVYIVLIIILGGWLLWIIPALIIQVQDLGGRMPDFIEQTGAWINSWRGNFAGDTFRNTLLSQLSNIGPALLQLPLTITSALFKVILILFISFYGLLAGPGMQEFLLSLFPEEMRTRIHNVSTAMVDAMGGYVRGAVINGLIVGFLTFLGLFLLGIDFAVIFGVMAGMLELIPVAGPIVAGVIIVSLTLLQSPAKALAALIYMIVMEQLEGHILVPNIMRSQTKVSPLLSILALFGGSAIGGLAGALIAIPVVAALRVLVQQVVAPAIRRRTGATTPKGVT
jgi:predicted PurR-regulated permease PerM